MIWWRCPTQKSNFAAENLVEIFPITPHDVTASPDAVTVVTINHEWRHYIALSLIQMFEYGTSDLSQANKDIFDPLLYAFIDDLYSFETLGDGTVPYTIQADIELDEDVLSYTFTDLAALPGRDLILTVQAAQPDPDTKDVQVRVNEIDTNSYFFYRVQFKSLTYYLRVSATRMHFYRSAEVGATPQLAYGYLELIFPNWKDTDRHKNVDFKARGNFHQVGDCIVQTLDAIDSITVYASSPGLKAGSKFAIYTRG